MFEAEVALYSSSTPKRKVMRARRASTPHPSDVGRQYDWVRLSHAHTGRIDELSANDLNCGAIHPGRVRHHAGRRQHNGHDSARHSPGFLACSRLYDHVGTEGPGADGPLVHVKRHFEAVP